MKPLFLKILGISFLLFFPSVFAAMDKENFSLSPQQKMIYDPDPSQGLWGWALYYSRLQDKLLNQNLRFEYNRDKDDLYSAEINYRLSKANPLSEFFNIFRAKFEVNGNFTYEDAPSHSIYEFTPYFDVRWIDFPWNKYVTTTFAIGEGVSYATAIPLYERREHRQKINGKRFENYLMFEATLSLPKRPDWQLIYRIHHRSGVFGMYDSSNSGSTAVGVGIRHYFEWDS